MPKTAIIYTDVLTPSPSFEQQIVKTIYGNVLLYVREKTILLPRQGKNMAIPPHRINHKANICALNVLGVEKIIGVERVKSLKKAFTPGTIILPHDY